MKQHCWMRRARLVAREFAWLDTQRDALFSPATSTATTRITPAVYMHKQSSGWILASADIKDAYLTVRQRIPTTISVDIGGATRGYKLLMCVPGQRDGSANWYEDLSTYVTQRLETSAVAEAPTFFRSLSGDLIFNVHVDDLLMAGSPEAVDNMLAVLGKKYELNVEFRRHEGDDISFLKRKPVLLPGNRLGIEAHPKHVQKMLDMLKLHNVRPRKTPLPVGSLPCDEETPPLAWKEAMVFRQCVGILLYLSGDIIEAQFGIRLLSQKMSSPCVGDMKTLKHLVSYLGSTQYRMLVYERPQVGRGFAGCSPHGELLLEAFTDSDWSSCKATRRSVSASAIMLDGLMVSSSSRTQRSISLSTAEAEFNAATSTMCDALYIRNILAGLLPDEKVYLRLLCDSAAARGIIAKSGVGRIKHLDGKMLWLQSKRREPGIGCAAVSTVYNISDIGTKALSRTRINFLHFCAGICDEEGNPVGAAEAAEEERRLEVSNAIRRIQVDERRVWCFRFPWHDLSEEGTAHWDHERFGARKSGLGKW